MEQGSIQLYKDIRSDNEGKIIAAIEKLRHSGKPSAIPVIIEVLASSKKMEVRNTISAFLNDLKDRNSVPEVMKAILNPGYLHIKQILISSCWQSGLDYSRYAHEFVNILASDELLNAIEAYSVLEISGDYFSGIELSNLILYIDQQIPTAKEENKALMEALKKALTEPEL
jgi:hypothetical protein